MKEFWKRFCTLFSLFFTAVGWFISFGLGALFLPFYNNITNCRNSTQAPLAPNGTALNDNPNNSTLLDENCVLDGLYGAKNFTIINMTMSALAVASASVVAVICMRKCCGCGNNNTEDDTTRDRARANP